MARTKRGRTGRYAAPTQRHPFRNVAAGIVGTFLALAVIGACSDDESAADDGPVPTVIDVGRGGDDGTRTVTILEDGHDGQDEGRRVMTQDDFPCNEDEVLAYHPSFGPDHVGCLHYEDIE